jgi:hypothetical protein
VETRLPAVRCRVDAVLVPDGNLSDHGRGLVRPGDLSRVRQQRSPHPVTCRGADVGGRDAGRANAPEYQPSRVSCTTKCLLIAGFYDGRGWFRTSVLSRVNRDEGTGGQPPEQGTLF